MTDLPFNPNEFKLDQRRDWNSVSRGWEKWWETIEHGAQPISDRLLELADIKAGHRVLDIATGIGEPALSAAKVVGKNGHVVATDQATNMLAIAEKRAKSLGLNNLSFRQMDGENFDSNMSNFDSVLCRWGLMFMPDFNSALESVFNSLVPGGKFATAVWSTADKVPSINLAMSVVSQVLDLPPPAKDAPSPFGLADTGLLEKHFKDAGFDHVHIEPMTMNFSLISAEDYTQFSRDVSAPLIALVSKHPLRLQNKIWSAITDAVREKFELKDGSIKIENEAICIVGEKAE